MPDHRNHQNMLCAVCVHDFNKNRYQVTVIEYVLYIWIAAFAYDELGEYLDAGGVLYSVNAWNAIDVVIILLGVTFIAMSKILLLPLH